MGLVFSWPNQEIQQPSSSLDLQSMPCDTNLEEAPETPIPDDEEPAKKLFFDLLADDSREITTRLLSSEPNAGSWPLGLSAEDVSLLYEVNGEYGRYIASRFNTTCIVETTEFFLPWQDVLKEKPT